MIYSAAGVELSIYSTCKRISQKLLRNVQTFLREIYLQVGTEPMREINANMEEIVLQGREGARDTRKVNSYPSKVCVFSDPFLYVACVIKDAVSSLCYIWTLYVPVDLILWPLSAMHFLRVKPCLS